MTSPARGIKRLKVDNRRTRILTPDEQRRIEAAPRTMRAFMTLALITGARAGELLGLRWEHVEKDALTFLETKNGKPRRPLPLSPAARAVLAEFKPVPGRPYVTNPRTGDRYTVNGPATSSTGRCGGPTSPAPTGHGTRSGTRPSAG